MQMKPQKKRCSRAAHATTGKKKKMKRNFSTVSHFFPPHVMEHNFSDLNSIGEKKKCLFCLFFLFVFLKLSISNGDASSSLWRVTLEYKIQTKVLYRDEKEKIDKMSATMILENNLYSCTTEKPNKKSCSNNKKKTKNYSSTNVMVSWWDSSVSIWRKS